MTWNLLSETKLDGYDRVDADNLVWEKRKNLFRQEIHRLDDADEKMWDFICIQDYDSKSVQLLEDDKLMRDLVEWRADGVTGCAIYYNSRKFELVNQESGPFYSSN